MILERDIYKEHIIDLCKHPKNFGELKGKTHESRGINAFCGDDISFSLVVKKDKIEKAMFQGKGCAICMASASLISEYVKEKKTEEIKKIGAKKVTELLGVELGPARIKCALLPLDVIKK